MRHDRRPLRELQKEKLLVLEVETEPVGNKEGGEEVNFKWDYGVSLVATMHNEEKQLPHFIRHYQDLGVSDIYLLDDGSTDDSVRWAGSLGATVESTSFGTYRADHYYALDRVLRLMTQTHAVIWVDLDEYIKPICNMSAVDVGYAEAWECVRKDIGSSLPADIGVFDWDGFAHLRIPKQRYDKMFYFRYDQRAFLESRRHKCFGRHPVHHITCHDAMMYHVRDLSPGYFMERGLRSTARGFKMDGGLGVHIKNVSEQEWQRRYDQLRKDAGV